MCTLFSVQIGAKNSAGASLYSEKKVVAGKITNVYVACVFSPLIYFYFVQQQIPLYAHLVCFFLICELNITLESIHYNSS